jgi:hypothetical protein
MSKSAAKFASLYDVQPGVAMVQKWIADLKPKTGRTLEEWIALVKTEGPKAHLARSSWLKSKQQIGNNAAWWIADRADGKGGTFVLQHNATMQRGSYQLNIIVVPDSGTGQLTGLTGTMNIIVAPNGKHSNEFSYSFPEQK